MTREQPKTGPGLSRCLFLRHSDRVSRELSSFSARLVALWKSLRMFSRSSDGSMYEDFKISAGNSVLPILGSKAKNGAFMPLRTPFQKDRRQDVFLSVVFMVGLRWLYLNP